MNKAPKKTDDRRTERLQIRLLPDEKTMFQDAAERDGDLEYSAWARRILVREARRTLRRA